MDRNHNQFGMVGTWELDIKKNELTWSPQTYLIFGVTAKKFDHTFEAYVNLVHPDYRSELISKQSAAIKTGSKFDLVHRIVRTDGSIRTVREVGETLSVNGVAIFHGVIHDITDLLASALKADEAEELLNLAGRKARLGGWRYNVESKQLFWTAITAEIHEVPENTTPSVEEALNFYAPEHREIITRAFTSCIEEGTPFDEKLEIISKTGRRVWVRAIGEAELVIDGTISAVFGAFQDISDLTEAREESINLSAELYLLNAAAANLNDIIIITEADLLDAPDGPKIVYVNDALERLTGYTKDEVLGKTPRILQGTNTQRDRLLAIRHALESKSHIRTELINYTKGGEEYWLELDISPVYNKERNCTHFVSIERDVTERKQSEEAIRVSEERFRLVSRAVNDVIWDWKLCLTAYGEVND